MKPKNFVIVSLSPWDFEFGSNIRDIALELSNKHNVLFVNIPMKRTELLSKKKKWVRERAAIIKSKQNSFQKINENCQVLTTPVVFEPINKIKSRSVFDYLNKINTKRYAKAIRKATESLGFDEFYLINDNDFYSGFYLPDYLGAKKNIYYLRDYMRAMSYWDAHSHRLEPMLIEKYEMTLTNSAYLAKYASEFNQKSFYVGQGCDVDYFLNPPAKLEIPQDLNVFDGVKVGYVGALNSERLDVGLLEFLAKQNPEQNYILVGPEDEGFKNSALHEISNVHFLGSKDFEQLNGYLYNFDVCINPQKVNQITIGNYPRKVDEYLAVGKPVVASYTETMVPFQEVTYLAKAKEEFSEMVHMAISENNEQLTKQRKEFASAHTWRNSVDLMLDHIEKL